MFLKCILVQKVGFIKYKSGLLHGYKMKFLRVLLIVIYSKYIYIYFFFGFSVASLSANVLYSVKGETMTRKWIEEPQKKMFVI